MCKKGCAGGAAKRGVGRRHSTRELVGDGVELVGGVEVKGEKVKRSKGLGGVRGVKDA